MMAGTKGQGENSNESGIISGHAYSVLSAHKVSAQGTEWRLLKLRNPWGHDEWKGIWSDTSEIWTPELREELGCSVEDDGCFFIPFEDYLKNYDTTAISIETNSEKYQHTNIVHNFESVEKM